MSDENLSDGSEWVNLVRGTIQGELVIPPLTQSKLKNALLAEILVANPKLLGREELVSITFPTTKEARPCIKIDLMEGSSNDDKNTFSDFIASRTERYGNDFNQLLRGGSVTIENASGYFGRCHTTISARSVDDLVSAVASMASNPVIRNSLLGNGQGAYRQ